MVRVISKKEESRGKWYICVFIAYKSYCCIHTYMRTYVRNVATHLYALPVIGMGCYSILSLKGNTQLDNSYYIVEQ